jgi:hypothetical protein
MRQHARGVFKSGDQFCSLAVNVYRQSSGTFQARANGFGIEGRQAASIGDSAPMTARHYVGVRDSVTGSA